MRTTLEQQGFQCDLFFDKSDEEILQIMPSYDCWVIRSRFKITKEMIEKAKNLKCIARAGAGMENIDVDFAESKEIKCVHAPEGNKDAVAEHALAMLLALFNKTIKGDAEVRKGIWLREENRGIELHGKTVGIIGYGNMGQAFAERLIGFGVTVLVYDKYKKGFGNEFIQEVQMNKIFEEADVVSLHIPLTAETNYLVNKNFISQFKKSFYLINTSRGKCVNTNDLVNALKENKILGACLDVLEFETVSFANVNVTDLPKAFSELIQSDKVVLSPHIAGWTVESHLKIGKILAEKIINALNKA